MIKHKKVKKKAINLQFLLAKRKNGCKLHNTCILSLAEKRDRLIKKKK